MTRVEWAAAALIAVAIAYAVWDFTRIGRVADQPSEAYAAAARTPDARRKSGRSSEAVVTRALFAPSRRGAFGSAGGGAGMVGGHVLRGTLSGVTGWFAIFEPARGGPTRRLRIGNVIGGFSLTAIDEDSVLLVRDGRGRRLGIGDAAAPSAAVPLAADAGEPSAPRTTASPPPAFGDEALPIITAPDAEAEPS